MLLISDDKPSHIRKARFLSRFLFSCFISLSAKEPIGSRAMLAALSSQLSLSKPGIHLREMRLVRGYPIHLPGMCRPRHKRNSLLGAPDVGEETRNLLPPA